MESVLGRYRNLIVLVGVLFAQILGLAVQVKRTSDSESTRLIRVWAVSAVSPLEKALVWTQTSTFNLWHNYFYLRGVRAENRALKEQIEQMRIEQVRMTQDAEQAHRLQALLGFKEQFISKTVAAQVIGGSGSDLSRIIYIDRGFRDGVAPDMSVITADGIVGKVLRADRPHVAQVLLIDDQTSGVGAILKESRTQGILRGSAAGELMLEKVMSDETVPIGETVLTSGGDGIFPKGLPIGHVSRVKPGSELFLNIGVRPAADLGRLEEVLVVTKIDEKQAQPDQNGSARAVDILAERLPTVPKPAAAADSTAPTGQNASATSQSGSLSGTAANTTTAKSAGVSSSGATNGTASVIKKPSSSASASASAGAASSAQTRRTQAVPTQVAPDAKPGISASGNVASTPPAAKPDSTSKPKTPPQTSLTQTAASGSATAAAKPLSAAGQSQMKPSQPSPSQLKPVELTASQSGLTQSNSTQTKPAQPKLTQPKSSQPDPAVQDSPH